VNAPLVPPILSPVQPGDVVRGKYRVERLLGQGGMAYVVSAWHIHLEQRVAIKLLRPEIVEQPEVIERFLREARAASRLEGNNVARVLDVDTLDTGSPFIVLEYLEGSDLAHVLIDRAPLPPDEVAGWVQQACSAVAEAHALGVIHRDLKPANLFLAKKRSGETLIKVLDFGISKLLEDTRITQTAVGMGSAEYMSPEQMKSATDVDARSDIWSLGVTLYELLTGKTPFHAEGVGQVAAAVLMKDPAPPRKRRPDIPAGLEAVILRCLDKDPDRRFAGAGDLYAALAPFARAAPAVPPPPPSVQRPSPTLIDPPAPGKVQALPVLVGAGIAVLALSVVVAAFAFGRGKGGAGAGQASPSAHRFQISGDTLLDTETHLAWQRKPMQGTADWSKAKAHCNHAGEGFRLPELEELSGLLPVTAPPAVDPVGFTATPLDVYWSAKQAGPSSAMVVRFSDGKQWSNVISTPNRVRCVRSGS
jgi:eukaryotic-like serine/threonine-protein kinase